VHSEQNAIIQAAMHGLSTEGSILCCTLLPSTQCTKMLINARVCRVVYREDYPDEGYGSMGFFEKAVVEIYRI